MVVVQHPSAGTVQIGIEVRPAIRNRRVSLGINNEIANPVSTGDTVGIAIKQVAGHVGNGVANGEPVDTLG